MNWLCFKSSVSVGEYYFVWKIMFWMNYFNLYVILFMIIIILVLIMLILVMNMIDMEIFWCWWMVVFWKMCVKIWFIRISWVNNKIVNYLLGMLIVVMNVVVVENWRFVMVVKKYGVIIVLKVGNYGLMRMFYVCFCILVMFK